MGLAGEGGEAGMIDLDACVPVPCTRTECGEMADDGCGNLVRCACPDACTRTTCAAEGAECGTISDGCGDTLDCGDCTGDDDCGGTGVPNICGHDTCRPTSCAAEGRVCGPLDDGCGKVLECGSCQGACGCGADGQCIEGAREEAVELPARAWASAGFAGSEEDYNALYSLPCVGVAECIVPCINNGGTDAMCAAAECVDSSEDYCVPATIWTELDTLGTEGTNPMLDCAELVLVSGAYRDPLLLTDFGFAVPESAEITGVTVRVRRAARSGNEAADAGVHLLKGGVQGSADRSMPGLWPGPDLAEVEYGGPDDLWGQTLSPADVNAPDFGVALAVGFTQGIGNGRAYVDIVYASVRYRTACAASAD
jgi:hypothetical protein